jgi:hypothetical protein
MRTTMCKSLLKRRSSVSELFRLRVLSMRRSCDFRCLTSTHTTHTTGQLVGSVLKVLVFARDRAIIAHLETLQFSRVRMLDCVEQSGIDLQVRSGLAGAVCAVQSALDGSITWPNHRSTTELALDTEALSREAGLFAVDDLSEGRRWASETGSRGSGRTGRLYESIA